MKSLWFALALAILASPSIGKACSQSDLGAEIYCGTYRGAVKTSFNLTANGDFATPKHFESLTALLQSIPPDDEMRSKYDYSGSGPNTRSEPEQVNVDLVAYLVAVKPGEDDHDLHVIISDGPLGTGAVFMNAEVSGLPRDGSQRHIFEAPRQQIASVVPQVSGTSGRYIKISGARPVHIQGSLYFDGDHKAGCSSGCPGPSYARPNTVWEIHPIYLIEPAAESNFLKVSLKAPQILAAADLKGVMAIKRVNYRTVRHHHRRHRHHVS